jgi:hypothetical protein
LTVEVVSTDKVVISDEIDEFGVVFGKVVFWEVEVVIKVEDIVTVDDNVSAGVAK